MEGNSGRITRTTAFMAVFVAILMLGIPSFQLGNLRVDTDPIESASAANPGNRVLREGWVNLVGDIQTLNPLLYTMGAEFVVIWPCYSTVLTRDVDNQLVGDLATSWKTSIDGRTWTIKIVQNAKFYDKNAPLVDHPLKVDDIIYTYWLVQNSTNNYLQYFFPAIPGTGGRLIQSMAKISDFEMTITLRAQYAPFLSALTTIPILPKYLWSTKAWNWDNFDSRAGIAPLIGSGMFVYNLNGLPTTNTVELIRNPGWFATEEYGWQIRPSRLLLISETYDSNIADYNNGVIDIIIGPTNEQYLGSLPGPGGFKWTSSQGFVFEYNLNQLTDENRDLFNVGGPTDYNNQLLLDPVVKLAMAMSVDKTAFIRDVLGGLGQYADSLIPGVSPWHYWYGLQPSEDPLKGRAPVGEEPVVFDTAAARQLLIDAGWAYTLTGDAAPAGYYPLCKAGGTDPLRFRMVSPNDMTEFIEGSNLIDMWAQQAGVDLMYAPKATNTMNTLWAQADYDTWLWDWWFTPNSEPSVDVMQVLATEAIGSWSDVYWSNATYDSLYYQSLSEMDPYARMQILDEMQRMAYENLGCQAVAYMDMLYAAHAVGPEFWQNWGNWNAKYPLTPDSGYPWLFTQIYPQDNNAPNIYSFQPSYEEDKGVAVQFTAGANDDASPLLYRWNFGDGTKSAWSSDPAASHAYAQDGYYNAYLMVKENSGLDQFISWKKASVKIIDTSNTVPHSLAFTVQPEDPDSGTLVYFNGTAVDDNGDPLSYSWTFGDGYSEFGQRVTHQFAKGDPSYTVTMFVDDGHLGLQSRPVSLPQLVIVSSNSPPSLNVGDFPSVPWKVNTQFTCVASDSNPRDQLRFTWEWGDGTRSVTSTNSAWHSYSQKKTYTLRVWLDDLTGLPGHNVSDTGLVTVLQTNNVSPVVTEFYANNTTPMTGQVVRFTGTATDGNGDLLTFTFAFGDGGTSVQTQTVANSTLTADYSYADVGVYFAALTVSDGQAAPVTYPTQILMIVSQGNQAPVVDPLGGPIYRTTDETIDFTATATDPDSDPLTYTWDFGDGTPLEVGQSVQHAYAVPSGPAGFRVDVFVDDGQGHNSSEAMLAVINSVPVLDPFDDITVMGTVVNTYTALATDADLDDTLVYTWDFGDGSPLVAGQSVDYAYADVPTTTTYTLTVWVDDGFVDDMSVSHIVSDTATITVEPLDLPPVADAGPDQTKMGGELVTLDGSGSSDDYGIVNWTWTFMDGATPVTLYGEVVEYAWMNTDVVYVVTLTVEDTIGQTSQDTAEYTIAGWIPEFPVLLLPVAGILAVVVFVSLRRRRGHTQ